MDNQFVWKKTSSSKYELVDKHILNENDEYELYNKNDNFSIYNLSKLKIINIPTIMNVLRERYQQDDIYTFNGKVLISINPFKSISNLYENMQINDSDIPHIYSVSENAYKNINKKNQAILVSGESGSGKTENTKYILKYLSNNYSLDDSISNKIISCNHLIECMGNAKTIKNDNSSRFGKFIKLFFNSDNKIIGANIENYLLEKSRITSFNNLEKSYHIFYFYNSHLLKKYNFSDTYRLISTTDDEVIDEFRSPELFLQTLEEFQFTPEEIDRLFYTVKVILELSNIHNLDSMYKIINKIVPDLKFINLDEVSLLDKFTKKYFKIGNEMIVKDLEYVDSEVAIKSFCEDVYSELFNSIIAKINEKLGNKSDKFISILDIFGFEIFEKNGYEQICINYTNEILQNIYNKNVLENEQEEYKKEGVQWKYIEYNSNKQILELFQSKLSIFGIINEQSILSSGQDKNIYANIKKHLISHSNLSIGNRDVVNQAFSVEHYAGLVKYTVKDYIIKNRRKSKNRKIKTNLQLFVNQLNSLQKQLDSCNCMFIRCIKPNDNNISDTFDYEKIHNQLLYSGVIEGIKLVLKGYPVKIKIDNLDSEFRYIYGSNLNISQIFNQHSIENDKYCFGKSKIFMKRDAYDILASEDNNLLQKYGSIVVRYMRGYFDRKKFREKKHSTIVIQKCFRGHIAKKLLNQLKQYKYSTVIQKYVRGFIARNKYRAIIQYIKLIQRTYRNFLFKKLIYKRVRIRVIKNYSAKVIQNAIQCFIDKKKEERKKDIIFQNNKLKTALEEVQHQSNKEIIKFESKLNEQQMEIERLKNIINNKNADDSIESEDIPINSQDMSHQKELEDKDREIEELKKQLAEKNSKKTKLTDSINEKYIVNSPDEDSLVDIDLYDNKRESNNAVQLVGKKLENMYMELNTRNEMMEQLARKYQHLERQLEIEKRKSKPSLWDFLFG